MVISDERGHSAHEYEVECVPLFSEYGKTRFLGTRRKDTGQIFATVTSAYEVLQNHQLASAAEATFRSKGIALWKRNAIITHGGAHCYIVYDFPGIGGKVDGQELIFRMKLQNSFDGSIRAGFTVGMFRLICSNGLAMPTNTLNVTSKHTTSLDFELMSQSVERSVQVFFSSLCLFERMARISITQDEGVEIMRRLASRRFLGLRQTQGVIDIWNKPKYEADRGRNLWNLYNAVTQHMTHDVAGDVMRPRYEFAERCTRTITLEFMSAARKGTVLPLLMGSELVISET